jgi:hypothetical protein
MHMPSRAVWVAWAVWTCSTLIVACLGPPRYLHVWLFSRSALHILLDGQLRRRTRPGLRHDHGKDSILVRHFGVRRIDIVGQRDGSLEATERAFH